MALTANDSYAYRTLSRRKANPLTRQTPAVGAAASPAMAQPADPVTQAIAPATMTRTQLPSAQPQQPAPPPSPLQRSSLAAGQQGKPVQQLPGFNQALGLAQAGVDPL